MATRTSAYVPGLCADTKKKRHYVGRTTRLTSGTSTSKICARGKGRRGSKKRPAAEGVRSRPFIPFRGRARGTSKRGEGHDDNGSNNNEVWKRSSQLTKTAAKTNYGNLAQTLPTNIKSFPQRHEVEVDDRPGNSLSVRYTRIGQARGIATARNLASSTKATIGCLHGDQKTPWGSTGAEDAKILRHLGVATATQADTKRPANR